LPEQALAGLRRWTGKLRTADEGAYLDYVMRTGGGDIANTVGNLGHQIVMRTLDDGTSEIAALSWWRDMDAVRGLPARSRRSPSTTPRTTAT
jgi:hypothetical protein